MSDEQEQKSVEALLEMKRKHREHGKMLRELEKQKGVDYEVHKRLVAEAQKKKTLAAQDIGAIPKIKDPVRRAAGCASFVEFCKIYLKDQFNLPWAPYHYRCAEKIERAAIHGGYFALAVPRSGGKTTLCKAGVLWSILSGACRYAVLVAATEGMGKDLLNEGLKVTLLHNRLLLEDFPHAIYPFRKMDGEARAATGQRYKGERTLIGWKETSVKFAWIPEAESLSPGSVIQTFGMNSSIRGRIYTLPDGTQIRPSFVLADDCQTRESAASAATSAKHIEIMTGDLAYLAGPTSNIAMVAPMTVIYEGDMADQLLNRKSHPEWQGERVKMVEEFGTPEAMKHWDIYADKSRSDLEADKLPVAGTDYYKSHWQEMNDGFRVSWPERMKPGEISGIQHAMNWKIKSEAAFWAECQNEPLVQTSEMSLLSADDICVKTKGFKKGEIPPECSVLTAFTDVQQEHLFWMIAAWTPEFTGYVIDYGAWPEQGKNYFTRHDVTRGPRRLSLQYPGDESGMVHAALTELGHKLNSKYVTTDGRELSLTRWCIDGNWRQREQAVRSYAMQSPYRTVITITYGRGVKATQVPFSDAIRAKKWKTGPGWFWIDGPGPAKGVTFDANIWKRRIHNGLALATGSVGAIHLFDAPKVMHRMLAEHLLAEKPVKTEANGRTVYEWLEIPGRDNEGLDSLVGCTLAASIAGIVPESERIKPKPAPAMSLADYAAAAKKR